MVKQRLVIVLAVVAIWAFAIGQRYFAFHGATAEPPQRAKSQPQRAESYGAPVQLGRLQDPDVKESSGIVASRANPGLFWTHNDSGDGPFIYAFDRQGKSRGVWRVTGASARDWEDIAIGPGPVGNHSYLYVGDIGDNNSRRATVEIYRFVEPTIAATDPPSSKRKPQATAAAEVIHLRYPDGSHDSETLLVHPSSGDIYLITKEFLGKAGVYKAKGLVGSEQTITLTHVGDLSIPSLLGGFVTGGDISPDGRRVAICDYTRGYELVIGVGRPFDEIWK